MCLSLLLVVDLVEWLHAEVDIVFDVEVAGAEFC